LNTLKINPRVAAGGIGAHLGNLLIWGIRDGIGLSLPDTVEGSIIALSAFLAGWALKD
jgi:hypothetical protein